MWSLLFLLPTALAAPLTLQSSVTLPPMIAANLDEYSLLQYRLGALMSDMDTLIYAEDGAITKEEMEKLVKETYSTANTTMNYRILVVDKELGERAEELSAKGIKLEEIEPTQSDNIEELQSRIVKAREDMSEIVDDEENLEGMKKKYAIDKDIQASIKRLHAQLQDMMKKGEFEKDIKVSMKMLGPRGPFGTALV